MFVCTSVRIGTDLYVDVVVDVVVVWVLNVHSCYSIARKQRYMILGPINH
jgi:hypothetical protein